MSPSSRFGALRRRFVGYSTTPTDVADAAADAASIRWSVDCPRQEERCTYRSTVGGMSVLVEPRYYSNEWKVAVFTGLGSMSIMGTRDRLKSLEDAKQAALQMVDELKAVGCHGS